MESLGVNNFDVCIVAIGDDFQSSLETTSLLKELDAKKIGFPCGTGSTRKIPSAKRCG